MNIYIYILVMAVVTYLIRMLPLTLIRGKIKSRFIRSFLYYVPYACLMAMTFPAVFFSASSMLAAIAGVIVAIILALKGKGLMTVALAASITVFLVSLIPGLI
ncbi:MAG: AzlD domain-containing protein [Lachnospiraceae bacterium]|nr:AzlD domain-containing protein [Lachnospiraceae bacterium]MCR4624957.1 AzlD domain-containing protein [Lachnospiraceae bacterium]